MYTYYSLGYLIKSNRPIDRALLKYGFSNFSLEILEYFKKDNYMDLLKPEYNIVEIDFVLSDVVLKRKALSTNNATAARKLTIIVKNIEREELEYTSLRKSFRCVKNFNKSSFIN